jgi:3-carboxy-cis,cis-muconate cycloisomerase
MASTCGKDAIRHHCDPVNYLGPCGPMVDRVLKRSNIG